MKPVGILRFLGTNCDADVAAACDSLRLPNKYVWWADHFDPAEFSSFVLPGGFSYGDYLRPGALASKAPAMEDLRRAAELGWPILGICNGFQILCESGLLPGVLTKNISQKFQEEWVELESLKANKRLKLPIAHSLGRFYASPSTLETLLNNNQVWIRYVRNPNGSLHDIAGLTNEGGNIAALMPHPERAIHSWMGSEDGRSIFERLVS